MKFKYRELTLKSKTYKIYEPAVIPSQLRTLHQAPDYSCILANAEGFQLLHDLFVLLLTLKEENAVFIVPDASADYEDFQIWYQGAEFHKSLIMVNYERTQVSPKDLKRLMGMLKYTKARIHELNVPNVNYENIKYWGLDKTLTVKGHGKWVMLSSNYQGYLYMAREANYYLDMEDDPEEDFSHSHLYFLTRRVDVLDMRYYFQPNEAIQNELIKNEVVHNDVIQNDVIQNNTIHNDESE